MTDYLAIMYIAVIVAITVMLVASGPVAGFIEKNPTIVMLALGFLLMIGTTLIADGLGFHVPKGYIYSAMAFSALVEGLNMLSRRRGNPETAIQWLSGPKEINSRGVTIRAGVVEYWQKSQDNHEGVSADVGDH